MQDINLLDYFALARTQLVKTHAELKRTIGADTPLHAKVEVKLTPSQVNPENPIYQMGLSVTADVHEDGNSVFIVSLVFNAQYQPLGEGADGTLFHKYHTSLGRQLYPLAHAQLSGILAQFGLHRVRLPVEIIHRQAPADTGTTTQVH